MRKHNLKRRNLKDACVIKFAQKPLSFRKKEVLTAEEEKLKIAGTMLYWAEGSKSIKSQWIDFANSDPCMIKLFLNYLRIIYQIDEKRLRVYLYCYSDQNISDLISFWSRECSISKEQFTKPYVRDDFRLCGRKMTKGLIHVRYSDKKLWSEIMKMIEEYKFDFASVV